MNRIVLTKEEMSHLQGLGLDCSRASMCHYKVFFHYGNYGKPFEDEDREFEDWKIDFMEEGLPANFYGIPDDAGLDYSIVKEVIPAFCLSDILEMIPEDISLTKCEEDFWQCIYNESGEDVSLNGYVLREGKDSLTTAYNMLCWCINNGYIKTN